MEVNNKVCSFCNNPQILRKRFEIFSKKKSLIHLRGQCQKWLSFMTFERLNQYDCRFAQLIFFICVNGFIFSDSGRCLAGRSRLGWRRTCLHGFQYRCVDSQHCVVQGATCAAMVINLGSGGSRVDSGIAFDSHVGGRIVFFCHDSVRHTYHVAGAGVCAVARIQRFWRKTSSARVSQQPVAWTGWPLYPPKQTLDYYWCKGLLLTHCGRCTPQE